MSTPLEDRLRAHFAEQAAREDIGEPDTQAIVTRALAAPRPLASDRRRRLRGRTTGIAVVAGLAAACLLAVVAVVATTGRHHDSVDISNEPSTTERPTTSAPEPSTTVESRPSATSTSLPQVPQTTEAVTVVRDGMVLGWWDGRGWVDPSGDSSTPLRGGESFQVLHLGQPATTATAGAPALAGCGAGEAYRVDLGLGSESGAFAAVTGVANVQPRPVTVLDTAPPAYHEAALALLPRLGIDDPDPTIAQVVRADIDGDGSDEALVVAERISDPQNLNAANGDYSVLFLRRLVNGSVQMSVVEQSHAVVGPGETPFVEQFRLGPIADLNGDGRMEVIVQTDYYEGGSTAAYELSATGTLESMMAAGCGV